MVAKQMRDEFWAKQFELAVKSPALWALQARRLKRGAELVFEAHTDDLAEMQGGRSPLDLKNLETAEVASLLYGLAFENIIKALIVKKEGVVIDGGKLQKWPRNHKLVNLAIRAGIVLTAAQLDLLARLTACVEWSGRYPVPLSQDKMRLEQEAVFPSWLPLPVNAYEAKTLADFYWTLDAQVLDA